ncbi:MAG: DUF1232 domain-containing protein [Pseudonocardia sp.]|nr:DUF1232 domain-containing protein [Pseudonocardia sp.]
MPTLGTRRVAALTALWRAVTQGSRRGSPGLGDRVRALPRLAVAAVTGRYPEALGRLALLVLGLAYLISPVDLVPEAVLGLIGLVDDAVVALWLGGTFLAETDRFLAWEQRSRPTVIDQPPPN